MADYVPLDVCLVLTIQSIRGIEPVFLFPPKTLGGQQRLLKQRVHHSFFSPDGQSFFNAPSGNQQQENLRNKPKNSNKSSSSSSSSAVPKTVISPPNESRNGKLQMMKNEQEISSSPPDSDSHHISSVENSSNGANPSNNSSKSGRDPKSRAQEKQEQDEDPDVEVESDSEEEETGIDELFGFKASVISPLLLPIKEHLMDRPNFFELEDLYVLTYPINLEKAKPPKPPTTTTTNVSQNNSSNSANMMLLSTKPPEEEKNLRHRSNTTTSQNAPDIENSSDAKERPKPAIISIPTTEEKKLLTSKTRSQTMSCVQSSGNNITPTNNSSQMISKKMNEFTPPVKEKKEHKYFSVSFVIRKSKTFQKLRNETLFGVEQYLSSLGSLLSILVSSLMREEQRCGYITDELNLLLKVKEKMNQDCTWKEYIETCIQKFAAKNTNSNIPASTTSNPKKFPPKIINTAPTQQAEASKLLNANFGQQQTYSAPVSPFFSPTHHPREKGALNNLTIQAANFAPPSQTNALITPTSSASEDFLSSTNHHHNLELPVLHEDTIRDFTQSEDDAFFSVSEDNEKSHFDFIADQKFLNLPSNLFSPNLLDDEAPKPTPPIPVLTRNSSSDQLMNPFQKFSTTFEDHFNWNPVSFLLSEVGDEENTQTTGHNCMVQELIQLIDQLRQGKPLVCSINSSVRVVLPRIAIPNISSRNPLESYKKQKYESEMLLKANNMSFYQGRQRLFQVSEYMHLPQFSILAKKFEIEEENLKKRYGDEKKSYFDIFSHFFANFHKPASVKMEQIEQIELTDAQDSSTKKKKKVLKQIVKQVVQEDEQNNEFIKPYHSCIPSFKISASFFNCSERILFKEWLHQIEMNRFNQNQTPIDKNNNNLSNLLNQNNNGSYLMLLDKNADFIHSKRNQLLNFEEFQKLMEIACPDRTIFQMAQTMNLDFETLAVTINHFKAWGLIEIVPLLSHKSILVLNDESADKLEFFNISRTKKYKNKIKSRKNSENELNLETEELEAKKSSKPENRKFQHQVDDADETESYATDIDNTNEDGSRNNSVSSQKKGNTTRHVFIDGTSKKNENHADSFEPTPTNDTVLIPFSNGDSQNQPKNASKGSITNKGSSISKGSFTNLSPKLQNVKEIIDFDKENEDDSETSVFPPTETIINEFNSLFSDVNISYLDVLSLFSMENDYQNHFVKFFEIVKQNTEALIQKQQMLKEKNNKSLKQALQALKNNTNSNLIEKQSENQISAQQQQQLDLQNEQQQIYSHLMNETFHYQDVGNEGSIRNETFEDDIFPFSPGAASRPSGSVNTKSKISKRRKISNKNQYENDEDENSSDFDSNSNDDNEEDGSVQRRPQNKIEETLINKSPPKSPLNENKLQQKFFVLILWLIGKKILRHKQTFIREVFPYLTQKSKLKNNDNQQAPKSKSKANKSKDQIITSFSTPALSAIAVRKPNASHLGPDSEENASASPDQNENENNNQFDEDDENNNQIFSKNDGEKGNIDENGLINTNRLTKKEMKHLKLITDDERLIRAYLKLSKYFDGKHSVDEILQLENVTHENLKEIVSIFSSVLLVYTV